MALPASRVTGNSSRVSFWQSGHSPTLLSAFLYFNFTFMVWVLLGPLAVQIAADLHLNPAQQGLLVATPLLAGALLRVALGMLADRVQPRLAGAIGQAAVIVALVIGWLMPVTTFADTLVLGVLIGVAGASFAVALQLAGCWYPPEHKGTALGIAGAGNFGTVIAALCGPPLAASFGWQNVLGLALVPLIPAFLFYLLAARDGPEPAPTTPLSAYLGVLRDHDACWFMFFYVVSFGGFVGLASFLTIYFSTEYSLSALHAGYCTALCVGAGSVFRPYGVRFAERLGGMRALAVIFSCAGALIALAGFGLPSVWMALLAFTGATLLLGMGNGAVFQLAPQRFRKDIGAMTAMIGGAGAIGGFLLAAALGLSRQLTGSYQAGLWMFAAWAALAVAGLWIVTARWRSRLSAVASRVVRV